MGWSDVYYLTYISYTELSLSWTEIGNTVTCSSDIEDDDYWPECDGADNPCYCEKQRHLGIRLVLTTELG